MKPYIVRAGDYLKKVALAVNADADAIWAHPRNAEVARARDPNLLHPGDVLWVPDRARPELAVAPGQANRYVATVPTTRVALCFKTDRAPYANEPYTVEGGGDAPAGATDGDGKLVLEVPVHATEVRVHFTRLKVIYPVRVGDMDPVDEPSGVRKRLRHLGYLEESLDEGRDDDGTAERDRGAVRAFQRARGLAPTGTLDDATRAALVEAHGS